MNRPIVPRAMAAAATTLFALFGALSADSAENQPLTPRAAALIDLTGQWVAVVSEDWRFRMMTPPRGDFSSVPLNAAGKQAAMAWDLDKDNANGDQCRAYGAAGLMRIPMRVRISWQGEATLRIETDAGKQVRLLHFDPREPTPPAAALQGYSVAEWQRQKQGGQFIAGFPSTKSTSPDTDKDGTLGVVTTHLQPGYLRKNGVPYSGDAVLTEYFNRYTLPNGQEWFVVTSVVDDPKYLRDPFVTSTDFKKEDDRSRWHPAPCETARPTLDQAVNSN